MRQLLPEKATSLWACHSRCWLKKGKEEAAALKEEAQDGMVIFSTQVQRTQRDRGKWAGHAKRWRLGSRSNEQHFALEMEMGNDNGAMETCHSFIT